LKHAAWQCYKPLTDDEQRRAAIYRAACQRAAFVVARFSQERILASYSEDADPEGLAIRAESLGWMP
jgi:hypothetical protein